MDVIRASKAMDVIRVSKVIYALLSVSGLALLLVAAVIGDIIGSVFGMGACALGVLGLEAQYTNTLIIKSREVK